MVFKSKIRCTSVTGSRNSNAVTRGSKKHLAKDVFLFRNIVGILPFSCPSSSSLDSTTRTDGNSYSDVKSTLHLLAIHLEYNRSASLKREKRNE